MFNWNSGAVAVDSAAKCPTPLGTSTGQPVSTEQQLLACEAGNFGAGRSSSSDLMLLLTNCQPQRPDDMALLSGSGLQGQVSLTYSKIDLASKRSLKVRN